MTTFAAITDLPPQVQGVLSEPRQQLWLDAYASCGLADEEAYDHAWKTLGLSDEFSFVTELSATKLESQDTGGIRTVESWIQALPLGIYHHPRYGKIDVTPAKVKEFADNINNEVRGIMLDVDYEHKDSPEGGRAAGWIVAAEDRGNNGLFVKVRWTPRAQQAIKDQEYRYFSAEFVDSWIHPKTQKSFSNVMFGGAITNRPFVKDIMPLNLSEMFAEKKGHSHPNGPPKNIAEHLANAHGVTDSKMPNDNKSMHMLHDKAHGMDITQFVPVGTSVTYADDESDYAVFFRDIPQAVRNKIPKEDFAGKGDSFPIEKPEDVSAAASSLGRAGAGNYSTDQIKANIIRIAKRKGAAYVAKLPEAWKKNLEEGRESKVLEELRKLYGLADDADEASVLAAATQAHGAAGTLTAIREKLSLSESDDVTKKLTELHTFFVDHTKDDERAKKFAEEFPEEAARLQKLAEQAVESEVKTKLSEWGHNKESKKGIPVKLHEEIGTYRKTLSGDAADSFDSIMENITKTGLVDFSERGTGGNTLEEEAQETEFLAEVKKFQDEKKVSYGEAVRAVSREHPELAQAWKDSAPVVTASQGGE